MKKLRFAAAAVALTLAAPAAFATNGYFAHGYGTKNKALGGAGTALPQDAMASATNPAGNAWVGDTFNIGIAAFAPDRGYSYDGAAGGLPATGSYDSENDMFAIPHIGYNTMLTESTGLGISLYANGGMNTEYTSAANGGNGVFMGGAFGGDATAGVNLEQAFLNLTFSHKLTENASVGISLIGAGQKFEAQGLAAFAGFTEAVALGGTANDLTDNGADYSYGGGVKVGFLAQDEHFAFGAAYQSRLWMTEFDDYNDLFAEDGDFDIPPVANVGIAIKGSENHTIVGDIQYIWYNDVNSIANPFSRLNACPANPDNCLGGSNGAGFGWDNMIVYKIGWQWKVNDDFTTRVGYSYGSQPIDNSEVMFNILAPGVQEHHYTFGFTIHPSDDFEFNFAGMYSPQSDVSGPHPMGGTGTVQIDMSQWEFEAGLAWKF